MTRTSMITEERFENDYANAYDEWGRSLGHQSRKTADAAGSMQTTLRDVAEFAMAVMQGRGLRKSTRDLMLNPQIRIVSQHEFPSLAPETTDENKSIRLSYGLGGLNPKIEILAFGTLCRERDCEWRRNEQLGDIPKHSGRWRSSG